MKMKFKVNSSAIQKVYYDSSSRVLSLMFTSSNKVYDYAPVPSYEVVRLLKSKSVGKYYNSFIRDQYNILR